MKKSASENNFWIVYADLMAGLLFVFILLLSAVITHYIFSQKSLQNASEQLSEQDHLIISKEALLKRLKTELAELGARLSSEVEHSEKLAKNLQNQDEKLAAQLASLDAKDLQIAALAATLNERLATINDKNAKIAALQADFGRIKSDFAALKNSKSELIARLAKRLDESLLIDLNSGSVQLANGVLFDSASFELKPAGREILARTLAKYFDAISAAGLLDQIDAIIIEGHTDSDGGYLYNLELSQKRSLEILKFIYELNPRKEILSLLSAVGRGYMQPVLNPDGSENKAASRRIEIKLIFSSNLAINEYEKRINDINFD